MREKKESKLDVMFDQMLGKAKKNSPTILAGLAILGLTSTVVASLNAGPKLKEIKAEYKEAIKKVAPTDKNGKRKVFMETAKKVTKTMVPVIVSSFTTAMCIVGSNSISSKRIAALTAAYNLSEKTVNAMNVKLKEQIGEKKAQTIKDAIVEDDLKKKCEESKDVSEVGTLPGGGNTLCMDMFTGRRFRSNPQHVNSAINKISAQARGETYVTVNDFYYALGLDGVDAGLDLGWMGEQTFGDGLLPIRLTSLLDPNTNEPILCITFDGLKPV